MRTRTRNVVLYLCAPGRDVIPVGGRQTENLFKVVRLEEEED